MNKTLSEYGRAQLKENLSFCNEAQQLLFKRMYSRNNLELPINEVVDNMPDDKIDWAMQQVERTLSKAAV